MIRNLIKEKGVALVEELREVIIEAEANTMVCYMIMDLFEYFADDLIDEVE